MKKKFIIMPILAILLLLNLSTFAQKKGKGEEQLTVPKFLMEEGQVVYSEVVIQNGLSANVLYTNCSAWFNSYYKNPTEVIKENIIDQKIKGKASFNLYLEDVKTATKSRAGLMAYSIEISFQEGKYKYEITKINKKEQSYFGIEKLIVANEKEYQYAYATYLIQTDEYMKDLISSLKKAMLTPATTKNKDW